MTVSDLLLYLAVGSISGFLAGLLGIGGGVVIVPILLFLFDRNGFASDVILPFALGTSLASIVVTSMMSTRSHHQRGTIEWWAVRAGAPWAALGTLLGALAAPSAPKLALACIIGISQLHVATVLLRQSFRKPVTAASSSGGEEIRKDSRNLLRWVSGAIGLVSSWIGIGGGALLVPFFTSLRFPVKRAVSTSAAFGFPISVAGALGFLAGGNSIAIHRLPEFSLGFIYLPAFIGIAIGSLTTVGWGAHIAHRIDANLLRRTFAVFLYIVAAKMLIKVFNTLV
jgi:uncharacterized protein